jgi:hypothetical protein
VNIHTLRKNVIRKLAKPDSNHGNSNLTNQQELRIVGYLQAFDLAGQGLTSVQTQAFVKKLHFKDKEDWDSIGWLNRFTAK